VHKSLKVDEYLVKANLSRASSIGLGLPAPRLGLYTILPLPILYGVWHTQEGSGEGRI